ncbi:hypothetical protein F5Y00DRAFT_269682 [Daldinia vernicosa]|uniref:uncharacterized protein n=1 Tax=Daldinia vernicosa TaxID=114800 RepID=UPI0020084C8D|nr:uncharacterized protein F5Y00DRAFT_269682 [Daldinia vernicosa]KAI0849016.1 hypothetical protein F5Y00DRAFT_269682 [Daldinia vernicosa]
MISMQRSLSSPVCIHSSPPASPSATSPPSRSPTPSPETRAEVSRPRRFRSRSPGRPGSGHRRRESSGSVRKVGTDETPRDATSKQQSSANPGTGASAPKKPVIDQVVGPPKPPPSPSPASSPPAPSSPLQPILKDQEDSGPFPRTLLADVSLYTNPHLTVENEGTTTLGELAHLVRLSKYQERKCANTRIRLQRSLISTALSARLTRCGETSLRNLADSFRNDDKRAFANLYGAIHDVRNSCDATRRYALLEPDMESLQSSGVASVETLVPPPSTAGSIGPGSSVAPFFNDISASAREAFLNFLTQIRTNPDYLATRLCALNATELQALTTFHQGLEPIESVLPYHGRSAGGRGHSSGPSRQTGQTPNAVERLLSFQRHDPLSGLIYTCFANSAGPDSAEDKRRTGIWATAFARLISTRSTSEPVLISILNAWSAMRDWSGRANMEWYLMKILEDGAFLLDRAEDQNGTRFNLSDWTTKDSIAAEEFYDRAVNDLFAIIDDEDATGIPEGVIELGNEILRRLEMKDSTRGLVDTTRRWFVYKWLFSSWLLAVVIHPESYGMMTEYHITEYGRQKILKQVATLAQHYVVEMLANNSAQKPVSTPLKIKGHVENILARFKPSGRRTGRLLPARSITSLRETAEVHPYLVISPADLVTLSNALFPERRPQSAHSSSIRSGAPSISGFSAISQPISIGTSRSNFETASVLSMSASSVFSDGTTSGDPLLEEQVAGTPQRRSPPMSDGARQKHANNYEEDGYRLRLAMHEMAQILGPEATSGSCHPCAERWAVVFISADGNSLSLQMTYDPDDEAEEENSSTTSDTEDDEPDEKPELDKDYHQLRDSVLKLVEDFEIPQGLEDHGTKTTFSNRASGLKKYRSKNKIITPGTTMGSRNPFRSKYEEEQKAKQAAEESSHASEDKEPEGEAGSSSVLITMLSAASSQSRIQSDFVSAHLYWKTLQQLNALSSPSLRKNGFATLLNIFSRGPRDSIRRSASAIEEYDAWLVWLKQSQERHEGLIETMMKRLKALRDKMWYVTDVHNSAPYEQTRNICSALKIMGVPRKWGSFQRNRAQLARGPAAAYIYRNESQMLDILAAGEEQGGPNKLSDAQAEITNKWLEQLGIQNMCQGEERIHRFCCEVDSCVSKLVGENIVDGPVLWSSELYSRDRKAFEGPRIGRDKESMWGDDAASVISSDHERRYASPTRRPASMARDLRGMSAYNTSQVSIDSHHRYSFSRASTAMSDTFDSHDYFGASSPIHAIDSTSTYWSPFQSTMSTVSSATSRAQSPTTSVTNLSSTFSQPNHQPLPSHHSASRSGASVSSNETVHFRRLSEGKQRFLADLRQTLTSLLLSELGNLVFASGSETDGWFGNLGQECIDRRDAEERRARRPSVKRDRASKSSAKQRVIEKRKSFGNLRQAGEASRADLGSDRPESASGRSNDSSATSDTVSARARSSKKKETQEFPYTKAYQRLLGMFAVHPNPYTKLNALLELERLISASLSNGSRRSRWTTRHQSASVDDDSSVPGKSDANETGGDNTRERRSQPFQSHMFPIQPRSTKNSDARSIVSVKEATNTDAIARVLRSLFKDAGIRPKTLFRDLQFINSFVSPSTLDTDRNKAFWDIVVVALSLKQDTITTMVEVADEILNYYTPSRKRPGGGDDAPEMMRQPPIHSLRDAAKMWTIAAKEGNATAQRELGLFNLSNPELVERSTLPLSKPRDVFKQAVMEKFGARPGSSARHSADRSRSNLGTAGPSSSGMQDTTMDGDVRSDPTLMCVAIHWMKEAERGGDELARTFLGQNEMMGL